LAASIDKAVKKKLNCSTVLCHQKGGAKGQSVALKSNPIVASLEQQAGRLLFL
jgi:hypothetical protein